MSDADKYKDAAPFLKIAPDVKLGENIKFGGFVNLYGCRIGDSCIIGTFVEIQRDVVVGDRAKIQSHSFLCSGVTVEDEAFIGHGVMFTNDRFPRATNADSSLKTGDHWECIPTRVGKRASIGSNATILCGVNIGEEALIGAGSVVVRDVPARTVVAGNPARFVRELQQNDPELA